VAEWLEPEKCVCKLLQSVMSPGKKVLVMVWWKKLLNRTLVAYVSA